MCSILDISQVFFPSIIQRSTSCSRRDRFVVSVRNTRSLPVLDIFSAASGTNCGADSMHTLNVVWIAVDSGKVKCALSGLLIVTEHCDQFSIGRAVSDISIFSQGVVRYSLRLLILIHHLPTPDCAASMVISKRKNNRGNPNF